MSFFAPKLPTTSAAPAPNNPEANAEARALARPSADRNLTKAKRSGTAALKVDLNSGTMFSGDGSASAGGSAGINIPRL
jgi:hypothetical protein